MQNRCIAATGMRLWPYSQSCQVRSLACTRSAAASCVSPTASRADRTSSLRSGVTNPFPLRHAVRARENGRMASHPMHPNHRRISDARAAV